jgi:histidinol phosphatase-like PHP family hydrolase
MLLPPFDSGQTFYRGNLHGHSTHSDGAFGAQQVAAEYRRLGYDFICLSDHLWTDTSFAAATVNDCGRLDRDGFVTIPSAELHCRGKKYDVFGLWHIVANGLPFDFKVASDAESAPELVQRALDAGAYVSIAHPEWYPMTTEEAMSVSHCHAVEIYNHTCTIHADRGSGIGIADFLLNEGRRISFNATDDSHFRSNDAGGGWVMVAAAELSAGSIVESLKAGRHYSSTGVLFKSISVEGRTLSVKTTPVEHVVMSGGGHYYDARNGSGMTHAQFRMPAKRWRFMRIAAIDACGRKAWSNPYWLDGLE